MQIEAIFVQTKCPVWDLNSIGNLSYTWDANKNKTSESISGVMSGYGFPSAGTTYDHEDRLTGFARASGSFTQSWNLTSVGDWKSVTTNGTAQTRTHGPTHELLTAGGQNACEETLAANGGAPKWKPGLNVRINGASRCGTTSGSLSYFFNNTDDPDLDTPDFWQKSKGDGGEGTRSFSMDWDCCCKADEQFANANGEPKWSAPTK